MNILVCYDGSKIADKALDAGIELGKCTGGDIHIFTSIQSRDESGEVFEYIRNDSEKEIIVREKQVEEACTLVRNAGLECQAHLSNRGKRTGEDIVDAAREMNAEYIVIGVRKRSRMDKMIFGSNVQYVVLKSSCPVVTVNQNSD